MRYFKYIFVLLFCPSLIKAQSKLNFGLLKNQDSITLPKSNGKIDNAKIKKFNGLKYFEIANNSGSYNLNNNWILAESNSIIENPIFSLQINNTKWQDAIVPGTVLTTLVHNGYYPDPYIGLNNMHIPEILSKKDWWYRIVLDIRNDINLNQLPWLDFEGINYKAEIWLNNIKIGNIDGAFNAKSFNVSKHIHKGKNILAVHILPPPNPGIPHEQSKLAGMGPNGGQLALDGPTFISSEGWDWVPGIRDRNMGIWQPVKLRFTNVITFDKPQIISDLPLPDTTRVYFTIKTTIHNNSDKPQNVNFHFNLANIDFKEKVLLKPNESRELILLPSQYDQLTMLNPKLWWPNGYGNQYLYPVYTSVSLGDSITSHHYNFNYGIRELSYEVLTDTKVNSPHRVLFSPTDLQLSSPIFDNSKRREFEKRVFIPTLRNENILNKMIQLDGENPYLVVKVNGYKIFCRGGNWGMDDAMKKVNRKNLEAAFQLHKESNFNMIRNWTGESTEEIFYELADEYGMLVWNDFWISTEGYNVNPLDQNLFLENSLNVIKRFRNHASIAIWCPRNEGYAPAGIEDELAIQIAKEDGTRFYIGNSREINLRPSGDWKYLESPVDYFNKYAYGFSTEIGSFSVPTANTIKKFLKKEDWWPINDAWHYHDLHSNNQNLEGYLQAIDQKYGESMSLDDFANKAQLLNYDTYRTIFESWNSRLWNNTSGILLWMTHPAWPSMIWQTYSYDFETTGAYYGSKKACEPIHVQYNLNDSSVSLINTTLQDLDNISIQIKIVNPDGIIVDETTKTVNSKSNSIINIKKTFLNNYNSKNAYIIKLVALKDQNIISENDYWINYKDQNSEQQKSYAKINFQIIEKKSDNKGEYLIIKNIGKSTAMGIKLNNIDNNGQNILPSFFSEGYFTLLPDQAKKIYYKSDIKISEILIEGYNFLNQKIKL